MTRPNQFADFERQYVPEPNTGCWLWIGHSVNGNYGSIKWHGKRILAHIFAYEWFKGPVPCGKELDHLCRTPFCVNPEHLEPVTHAENMARSKPATKTHCRHGHPYAEGLEIYQNETHRYRRCLTCYRMKYRGTIK